MQSSGEIQIAGALGAEFAPEAVIAGGTTTLLSAPLGTASVHGLIKTLFPISQASSGVLVPHTAESQVLLSLPVPSQAQSRRPPDSRRELIRDGLLLDTLIRHSVGAEARTRSRAAARGS